MKVPFALALTEDRIIRGDFFPCSSAPCGTLVICHGYKGFKDWGMFPYLGTAFSGRFHVVTFNFSHNGVGENLTDFTEPEKFAKNTYSRELEDLDEVVRALRRGWLTEAGDFGGLPEKSVNTRDLPLYLLGHSRGAGVALIYAFDYPDRVDGVIGWNGIVDVDLFSREQKEEMRRTGRSYVLNARTNQKLPLDREILDDMDQNKERFDILERVKEAKIPIALVQGTEDFERLRAGSEQLVRQNPNVCRVEIPGGNHTFGARHPFQGTTEPLERAIESTLQILDEWSEGARRP